MIFLNQTKYRVLFLVGFLALLLIGFLIFLYSKKTPTVPVTSFEMCAQAGYPIEESYPRRCKTPDGVVFVEKLAAKITYTNATNDLIIVDAPLPGAIVGKDIIVNGKARGTWFFEASFPVQLIDQNGTVLTTGIAQAQSDWMTENFVPFKVEIKVPQGYSGPAILLLKKDNPSGLPEHDASISFPVTIE